MTGRLVGDAVEGLRSCGFRQPSEKTCRVFIPSSPKDQTAKTLPYVVAGPLAVARIIGLPSCEVHRDMHSGGRLAASMEGLPFIREIP